jgi:hypothetical protein
VAGAAAGITETFSAWQGTSAQLLDNEGQLTFHIMAIQGRFYGQCARL